MKKGILGILFLVLSCGACFASDVVDFPLLVLDTKPVSTEVDSPEDNLLVIKDVGNSTKDNFLVIDTKKQNCLLRDRLVELGQNVEALKAQGFLICGEVE